VRLAELHARIRAHLRREVATVDAEIATPVGDLLVDTAARRATVRGREIPLRAKEFDLLARLIAEPGRAVSRETLMADVWDVNWFGPTKTLDVHVAAVRRKLAEAPSTPTPAPCPRSSPCGAMVTGWKPRSATEVSARPTLGPQTVNPVTSGARDATMRMWDI